MRKVAATQSCLQCKGDGCPSMDGWNFERTCPRPSLWLFGRGNFGVEQHSSSPITRLQSPGRPVAQSHAVCPVSNFDETLRNPLPLRFPDVCPSGVPQQSRSSDHAAANCNKVWLQLQLARFERCSMRAYDPLLFFPPRCGESCWAAKLGSGRVTAGWMLVLVWGPFLSESGVTTKEIRGSGGGRWSRRSTVEVSRWKEGRGIEKTDIKHELAGLEIPVTNTGGAEWKRKRATARIRSGLIRHKLVLKWDLVTMASKPGPKEAKQADAQAQAPSRLPGHTGAGPEERHSGMHMQPCTPWAHRGQGRSNAPRGCCSSTAWPRRRKALAPPLRRVHSTPFLD